MRATTNPGHCSLARRLCVLALLALVFYASGCSDPAESIGEEIKAELDDRLSAATQVYHFGCNDWPAASCDDGVRVCGPDAEAQMMTAWQQGQAIIVEAETGCAEPGCWVHYWFVAADGSGDHYYEEKTDIEPSDCGSYCGWHKDSYAAHHLVDPDGNLHLLHQDGEFSLAEIEQHCQQ